MAGAGRLWRHVRARYRKGEKTLDVRRSTFDNKPRGQQQSTAAGPEVFCSVRRLSSSVPLFSPYRCHGIETRRAAGWEPRRQERGGEHRGAGRDVGQRVHWTYAVQETLQGA